MTTPLLQFGDLKTAPGRTPRQPVAEVFCPNGCRPINAGRGHDSFSKDSTSRVVECLVECDGSTTGASVLPRVVERWERNASGEGRYVREHEPI